ncbi:uncharacterized protein [Ptychodera flava]|uniref:uncharacterized protein isoform X2 n=1 Tax=Ptychodera flava TaxID=63121 RepID=UPI003969E152
MVRKSRQWKLLYRTQLSNTQNTEQRLFSAFIVVWFVLILVVVLCYPIAERPSHPLVGNKVMSKTKVKHFNITSSQTPSEDQIGIRSVSKSTKRENATTGSTLMNLELESPGMEPVGKNITIASHQNSSRYLMVIFANPHSGPQNEYRRLRTGIALAIVQNRHYVPYPFKTHTSQTKMQNRRFNETFDIKRLRKLINVTEPRKFYSDCGRSLLIYNDHASLNISSVVATDIGLTLAEKELHFVNHDCQPHEKCTEYVNGTRCLVIVDPLDFIRWNPIANSEEIHFKVDSHLTRASFIRKMAKLAMGSICGGKPFLVFHWRNKTGEICEADHQSSGICGPRLLSLVDYGQEITQALTIILQERNLTCIYLAFPPFSGMMSKILHTYLKKSSPKRTSSEVFHNCTPTETIITSYLWWNKKLQFVRIVSLVVNRQVGL